MDGHQEDIRLLDTSIVLVVVGSAVVLVDIDQSGVPLVPDALGYLLVAIGGARLTQLDRTTHGLESRLARIGVSIAVIATLSGLVWLASSFGLRAPAEVATGGSAWIDAGLGSATVVAAVLLFRELSRWFHTRDLEPPARRLWRAAHVVGWPWGVVAALHVLAVGARPGSHDLVTRQVDTPLAVPLALGMFATLAYGAWALLDARADLRRLTQA